MRYISLVALLVAGLIHLLPVSGVSGAAQLSRLYGIEITDTNLLILLQHRAFLFGILGVFMLAAIPISNIRFAALIVGFFSAASFVVFAFLIGSFDEAIRRVVIADVVISVLLLSGIVVEVILKRQSSSF